MTKSCPFCGNPLPTHGPCCRVPGDLDRFERVYSRLAIDHHNPFLEGCLQRHLIAFGRISETVRRV